MRRSSWLPPALVLAATALVAALAAAWVVDGADRDEPDVVLVIGCTVRADQTSPWGGPAGISPSLQRLADEGARLETTIVQAPWTRPSIGSLLTGRYPAQVGQVDAGSGRSNRVLPPSATTLAELLSDAGWHTVGLAANPNVNRIFGFDQGFDDYTEYSQPWREDGVVKVEGSRVVADALAAVDKHDRRSRRPLFLQLVLVDTHLPWQGPAAEVRASEGPTRRVRTYRAMVRRLDRAVGELLEGLEARGRGPDDLVFAFIGDHGEGLRWPEHHGNGHGRTLYPSAVQVPWVVRGPGVAPGAVVGGLAAGLDLSPTLLGLVGVQPPEGLEGMDLSGALRSQDAVSERELAYTGTWFQGLDRSAIYREGTLCQVDGDPDRSSQDEERRRRQGKDSPDFQSGCFELASDPAAEHAVRDPYREADVSQWRSRMLHEVSMAETIEASMDSSLGDQLEALGYAEDD